ncbi:hypothetical protein KUV22_17075 [Microbulbifer agarilyticus]|uniref:immunity protein Tsi6 family protein n=1 Tax=Microbulbifer agarilyticus TaxID=260552 RepID=UPI001C95F354|nr:immunity protein Tsi6 family protein [Microbulbifer agarilyticus]MBY6192137.1 hypothetical protein [Microbulbifer agarilyticus]
MSQEDLKASICREALLICNDRIESKARVTLPQIMDSTKAQLEWLISYFETGTGDRAGLFNLTFGHFAAREIDESDRELIEALNKAFYVAVRTREGLKVDLNVLGTNS